MEDKTLSYEEWFNKLVELVEFHRINKKVVDTEMVRMYWSSGYAPAVALKFMFPEYWRF